MQVIHFISVVTLFCIVANVIAQPLRKTDWQVISSDATTEGYSYPRVASFKSGNYAIIYGYAAPNNMSGTRILRVNATTAMPYDTFEKESPLIPVGDYSDLGPLTAQNIVVFPDDTAYAVWETTGIIKCTGASMQETGTIASVAFYSSDFGNWNSSDYIDIVGSSWLHYAIGLSSDSVSLFLYHNPVSGTLVSDPAFSLVLSIHSAVGRKLVGGYPIIYTLATFQFDQYRIQATTVNASDFTLGSVKNVTNGVPFVMDDLNIVGGLFVTSDGRIRLITFGAGLLPLYQLDMTSNADPNFAPSVLQLGNNIVLVAYSKTDKRISYQMVKLSLTAAVLIGPEVTHDAPSTTMSVSMASTVGSDIIVVAKDVTGTQIMSRTITFCGNGALDLKEECDGSLGCTDQCKCQFGTIAVNGTCVDQCQNGIVTGYEDCDSGTGCLDCKCAPGYKPMSPRAQGCQLIPKEFVPNVKPQFDCLEITSTGLLLHFSFINNDGFDETIEYGGLNSFTPTTLGKDRPTLFMAGQSLTYPVSPYSTEVTNDTRSITWILSSYNLTVDFTNLSLLECPRSLSVDLTLSTFGNLTDALVQKLLQNIASKYNISESRLSAEYTLVSTNSQGLNTYLIIVTIGGAPNSTEQSSDQVIKDLLSDIQKSKEELDSDLTKGLEEINPVIKDITPSVIETRGQPAKPISISSSPPVQQTILNSSAARLPFASMIFALIVAPLL